MKNIIYTAYFVENQSDLIANIGVRKLVDSPIRVHAHHVTKEFRPKNGLTGVKVGERRKLYAYAQVVTGNIHAVLVHGKPGEDISTNQYPHITMATAGEATPKESNAAIENAAKYNRIQYFDKEIPINVIEGYFDGKDKMGV